MKNYAALVLLFISLLANSQTKEWQGSANWSDPISWPGGFAYAQLEFLGNGSALSNNDFSPNANAWRLYFNGGKSYTISGNPVQLFDFNGANSWVLSQSTVPNIINAQVTFADLGARPAWITTQNVGPLTLASISISGAVTNLRIAGSNAAGTISIGSITAAGKNIIIGRDESNVLQTSSRVFFTGDNSSSYSGTTEIVAGTLSVSNNEALGSGSIKIGNGAIMNSLAVTSSTTRNQGILISDGSTGSVIQVASGHNFAFSGVLSQSGINNITKFGKAGAGTLTMSGNSPYVGQIQIGEGTVVADGLNAFGTNTSTTSRGLDLGLNVADVIQAKNVAILASDGVTVAQSIYIAPNNGFGRTIGLNGVGSTTFSNQIYLDGNVTFAATGGTVTISGDLIHNGSITANGGIVALAGNNTYVGTTTIAAGVLRINSADRIANTSNFIFTGGTFNTGSQAGFNETVGSLSLYENSTIALGTGVHSLRFASSQNAIWANAKTLTITGWTPDSKIYIGTTSTGLTATQLAQVSFAGFSSGATITSTGEIIPYNSWIGTVDSNWDNAMNWYGNALPTASSSVQIRPGAFQPVIDKNIAVKNLKLLAGSNVIVQSGYDLTVANALQVDALANMTLQNNSNLLQTSSTNLNSGTVSIKRQSSALFRLDYSLWSSPVSGSQSLASFSPQTASNRFYAYNTATDSYASIATPATINFSTGKGYLIRMPNNWLPYVQSNPQPLSWEGTFIGVPNAGTFTVPLSTIGNRYNAVGNPYPSAMDIDTFISANSNVIEGTLWFWRKRNDTNNVSSYSTCTTVGCTLANNHTYPDPNTVSVGQGFLVKAKTGQSVLTYNESMTSSTNTNQFFRSQEVPGAGPDKYWISLKNSANVELGRNLIAYTSNATTGYDNGLDGLFIGDNQTYISSFAGEDEVVIQARPTFTIDDSISLNFSSETAQSFTLSLPESAGIFTAGQQVFLRDNFTDSIHNLTLSPYNFGTETGTFPSRFELLYQDQLLDTDVAQDSQVKVSVLKTNDVIKIVASNPILAVKFYDLSGRLIFSEKANLQAELVARNIRFVDFVIVKIEFENNITITKKVK